MSMERPWVSTVSPFFAMAAVIFASRTRAPPLLAVIETAWPLAHQPLPSVVSVSRYTKTPLFF